MEVTLSYEDYSSIYDEIVPTLWFRHLQLTIVGAQRIAYAIQIEKTSSVIHCSDGNFFLFYLLLLLLSRSLFFHFLSYFIILFFFFCPLILIYKFILIQKAGIELLNSQP